MFKTLESTQILVILACLRRGWAGPLWEFIGYLTLVRL